MNHGHCFLLKWHETAINRWYHWRYTYFQAKPVWDDLPQTRSCPNIHGCTSGSETRGETGLVRLHSTAEQPNWLMMGEMSRLGWSDHSFYDWNPENSSEKSGTRQGWSLHMLLFPSGYFNVWNISLDKLLQLLLQIPRQRISNDVPPGHAGGILWSHHLLKIQ